MQNDVNVIPFQESQSRFRHKVAILTNMMEFQPGYSLTGIVKDQARMLAEHGHEVLLFVNDHYHGEKFSENVTLKKVIPFTHLIDYASMNDLTAEHRHIQKETAAVLASELADIPVVLTHDFVFTGWFMPYGLACADAGKMLQKTRWLHWVHSIPSGVSRDWWSLRELYGTKHKIVYPNRTEMIRVAEQFKCWPEDVRVIPHIKDLRSWFDFHEDTCEFIKDFPAVMQADIVQVYPASVDRLEAKRVREVILILSKMKKMGQAVCLVLANQWATTQKEQQSIDQYKKIAQRNGLTVNEEVIFTSEWKNGKYNVGLPARILRELFQCSNLFIFPTREESFGLVLPEASLAGGVYCVLNKSLNMMFEVAGLCPIYFDFGSHHMSFTCTNEEQYFSDIAKIVIGRMAQNESVTTKTFMRRRYNWDALYDRYYAPIMAESQLWE